MPKTMQHPYVALLWNKTTATTVDSNSGAIDFPADVDGGVFILEHGTGTGTTPTLDVSIQVSPDEGTTWFSMFRFAQVTTTAGTRRIITSFRRVAEAGAEAAVGTTGGALASNCPLSKKIRILADVGGTSPSYASIKVWFIGARSALGASY